MKPSGALRLVCRGLRCRALTPAIGLGGWSMGESGAAERTRTAAIYLPPAPDVHPKSWTVNNRFLHVLISVLHRTQSV